jgi:peroxiredoxin
MKKRILLLAAATILTAALAAFAADPVQTGAAAPAFTEKAVSGADVTLAGYRGRPVLLWLTNFSSGSVAAAPDLIAMRDRHDGLTLLVASADGAYETEARGFADRFNMPHSVLLDLDGSTTQAYAGYFSEGASPVQNLYLIDGSGMVRGTWHFPGVPPRTLEAEVSKL